MKYIVDYELYNTLRAAKHSDGTPKYEVSVDEEDVLQLNIKCIAAGQKEKIEKELMDNSPVWKKEVLVLDGAAKWIQVEGRISDKPSFNEQLNSQLESIIERSNQI
ncbi:hypothetical protein E4630_12170 [Aeromonas hydrophila]|uniref:hypothetical protein n=1 Tax=Aeromonas hydrophila TaxID=644 RepID=UPI00107E966F|nr:hypothetical protein [Aeromonas hydrophila]QBX71556.1 hypothetical protein E4625_12390 [Aeromonas hydrophila]QBX76256.1 hypothetical protein E4630_12170 [Aeromonas hydrophila]